MAKSIDSNLRQKITTSTPYRFHRSQQSSDYDKSKPTNNPVLEFTPLNNCPTNEQYIIRTLTPESSNSFTEYHANKRVN